MLDLEAIKAEAECTAREYPETAEAEWAGDVLKLVAEVERLRGAAASAEQVFTTLLDEWEGGEQALIGEFSGSSAGKDLEEMRAEKAEWLARFRAAQAGEATP